jgi:DNA topoisomerase-1
MKIQKHRSRRIVAARHAAAAGLRHVGDHLPGLRRVKSGRGFRYLDANGEVVRDARTLARIRSIVIPPAWREVWIAPDPDGHLQATGRDSRRRKQYRYHPGWSSERDRAKFDRMAAFGLALPAIRRQVRRDLRRTGLGRERVLAVLVRLLEISAMRVGNKIYAHANGSYGLTTLRDRHVSMTGATIHFRFPGKGGHRYLIDITHPRLARIVKRCRALPGRDLFQYVDESGHAQRVTSLDVNTYLRGITGQDFSAKDFRTWCGTVLAALALRECAPADSAAKGRRNIAGAVRRVAEHLGNTPAVCRKSYIHPAIFASYLDGTLASMLGRKTPRQMGRSGPRLSSLEAGVIAILQRGPESCGPPGRKRREGDLARA